MTILWWTTSVEPIEWSHLKDTYMFLSNVFTSMATPAVLCVILGENDSSKISLPSGIPASVEELKSEIKRQCEVQEDFRLQYKDKDFDEFINLKSTSEIQSKATVKVIYLPSVLPTSSLCLSSETTSLSSVDTDILSSDSSSSSLRCEPWPNNFPVPEFTYDVELQLECGNADFQNNGTLLSPSPKLKSDILEGLASQIIKFKAYPSSAEFDDVAEALVKKHPCLKEQGCVSGFYGWKISLKYKMANYRTKLRNIGCSELTVNSLKRKQGDSRTSPNQVKKARRAEVNYCPDYPSGQSQDSLEEERLALLSEMKKSNNHQVVKAKMEMTFAYRRHEVIEDRPFIAEFKRRWPALFSEQEVEAEFSRITTVPLRSKFMQQLDHHTARLLTIFRKKGGAAGLKIRKIMKDLDKTDAIEARRACVLKALMVYVNEDPGHLIQEYMDVEDNQKSMDETVLGIYAITVEGAEPTDCLADVGIIIEGVNVLDELGNIANAVAILLGLMYSLDLSYPTNLKYTFEVLQKLVMELDANKLSTKVQVLKNKLFEGTP
ncbi:sterile alpha motif domain-containing protein 3-like isoform X1 [Salarias fasciatus]|uniref:sterile alpha motif domain-containing protein 3-like isoform X1 n=2 Tax=Salarias fasciatus TaxID=181472 RepID=UPI001176EF22|nr:sterile alpha motif domain-containing protein 3-like isoform X1 [Salarias fasciatus]